jgi:hypothetical protein
MIEAVSVLARTLTMLDGVSFLIGQSLLWPIIFYAYRRFRPVDSIMPGGLSPDQLFNDWNVRCALADIFCQP